MAAEAAFHLTKKQLIAQDRLGADALHTMLYGGSRSGKTFIICKSIAARAIAADESRHLISRFRLNALRASIVADTWPKMMKLCYPTVGYKLNKVDNFYEMQNGSQVWLGGLDDKERSEKVLGQEYATVFLNECSQIPWASRNILMTRLAQNVPLPNGGHLRLRAWYDCNPPSRAHWTYKLFMQLMDPINRNPVTDASRYNHFIMNPMDNVENLPEDYLEELRGMSKRDRMRFYEGQFGDVEEGALWSVELLDQQRYLEALPDFQRVVIAVDPSGCSGPEDERSDEIGIVVVGLGVNQQAYVLEDLSGRYEQLGDESWAAVVEGAFHRWQADRIVGEVNFGGAMVQAVLKARNPDLPFKEVRATRSKVVRAEPFSALFEQQKVWLAGEFEILEEQLCAMTMNGYTGDRSPDRADTMVWALADLFPQLVKKAEGETGRAKPAVVVSRPNIRRTASRR